MVKFSTVCIGITTAGLLAFAVGSSDAARVRAFYELRYGEADQVSLALEEELADDGTMSGELTMTVTAAIAGLLVPLVAMYQHHVAESDEA